MPKATFETPDGEEIEIEPSEVVRLAAGEEEGTTIIELENGEEVVVVATPLEAAAELDLDPLEFISAEEVDESLDEFDEEDEEIEE